MSKNKTAVSVPKQSRSIGSKARILSAAVEIFANSGLHGSRIDQIAAKSGVNKQRIYAYYGSKNNLYRQVLADAYEQAAQNSRLALLSENDLNCMTQKIIAAFFEFHQSHPLFWRLLSWENLNGGKSLMASDWNKIRNAYILNLKRLYKLGQSKNILRKDVSFDTYMLAIFSFTYFYSSNQLTISHLLKKRLHSRTVRRTIEIQFDRLLTEGLNVIR